MTTLKKILAAETVAQNKNLHAAKRNKNDEFYTQLTDIERELCHYKEHLKDKVIFCNCDDPIESDFIKYFALNFKHLKLKKLISTHYEVNKASYKIEITSGINKIEELNTIDKIPLKQNGDFRSPECIEILKEVDVVVTNPPFSLFREYVAQLIGYNKKFLIIGSMNAITYKEIFPLIKENQLWLGNNSIKEFFQPDGTIKKFGNILWYTNLSHKKRNEELILYKTYVGNEKEYPKYDNYDAIEVSKIKDIPIDYTDTMGVPITFLNKYNPKQFEIVSSNDYRKNDKVPFKSHGLIKDKDGAVNGTLVYVRILIKHV